MDIFYSILFLAVEYNNTKTGQISSQVTESLIKANRDKRGSRKGVEKPHNNKTTRRIHRKPMIPQQNLTFPIVA